MGWRMGGFWEVSPILLFSWWCFFMGFEVDGSIGIEKDGVCVLQGEA